MPSPSPASIDAAAPDTSTLWNASVMPSVAALLPPQRRLDATRPVARRVEPRGREGMRRQPVARERDPAAALPARDRRRLGEHAGGARALEPAVREQVARERRRAGAVAHAHQAVAVARALPGPRSRRRRSPRARGWSGPRPPATSSAARKPPSPSPRRTLTVVAVGVRGREVLVAVPVEVPDGHRVRLVADGHVRSAAELAVARCPGARPTTSLPVTAAATSCAPIGVEVAGGPAVGRVGRRREVRSRLRPSSSPATAPSSTADGLLPSAPYARSSIPSELKSATVRLAAGAATVARP